MPEYNMLIERLQQFLNKSPKLDELYKEFQELHVFEQIFIAIIFLFLLKYFIGKIFNRKSKLEILNIKINKTRTKLLKMKKSKQEKILQQFGKQYNEIFFKEVTRIKTYDDALKIYHKIRLNCLLPHISQTLRVQILKEHILCNIAKVDNLEINNYCLNLTVDLFDEGFKSDLYSPTADEIDFSRKVINSIKELYIAKTKTINISFQNEYLELIRDSFMLNSVMDNAITMMSRVKSTDSESYNRLIAKNKLLIAENLKIRQTIKISVVLIDKTYEYAKTLDLSNLDNVKLLSAIEEEFNEFIKFNFTKLIFDNEDIFYPKFVEYISCIYKYKTCLPEYILKIKEYEFFKITFEIVLKQKKYNFNILDSLIIMCKKFKINYDFITLINTLITIHWSNYNELKNAERSSEISMLLSQREQRELQARVHELMNNINNQRSINENLKIAKENKKIMIESLNLSKSAELNSHYARKNSEASKIKANEAASSAASAASSAAYAASVSR